MAAKPPCGLVLSSKVYYLQVDEYHRAKAASVIDSLLVNANAQDEKPEMTDATMTHKDISG